MQRVATLRAVKFAKSHERRKFGGKKRGTKQNANFGYSRACIFRANASLSAPTRIVHNSPIRKLKYTGHSLTRQSRMFIVF